MKVLHTMLRVGDLQKSLDFYCGILGMVEKRRADFPDGQFTLVFVGYKEDDYELELTYNYGVEKYELGNGYGHVALGVDDIHKVCDDLRQKGAKITREPGPMKHGRTVIGKLITTTITSLCVNSVSVRQHSLKILMDTRWNSLKIRPWKLSKYNITTITTHATASNSSRSSSSDDESSFSSEFARFDRAFDCVRLSMLYSLTTELLSNRLLCGTKCSATLSFAY